MLFRNKNIAFIFRLLLLVLFVSYYSNISVFYHSHLVDGRVVSHSHWFNDFENDKPVQSHSHTSEEYFLIHLLNHTNVENDVFIPEISTPIAVVYTLGTTYSSFSLSSNNCLNFHLRAPPAC